MNYFKYWMICFFISLSIATQAKKIKIAGKVENPTSTSIAINDLNNQEIASDEMNKNGRFKMSMKLESAYYQLNYGRNSIYLYLHPGDDLQINFDAEDFKNSLSFTGEGSARNNYLINKKRVEDEVTEDLDAFYNVSEEDYLKNIDSLKTIHLNLLKKYNTKAYFDQAEKKSLEYERLLAIQKYESYNEFYLGKTVSASDDFYQPIEELDLSQTKEFKSQPYYRYLVTSNWMERFEDTEDLKDMVKLFRKIKFNELAISLMLRFYSKLSADEERAKDYYKLLKAATSHQPFLDAVEKRYKESHYANYVEEGSESPNFKYEDINGKTVSLQDFEGKYVYIDVWATWCAPCIKQIPYLKELEEDYHDKNIVFISISVDKEKSKSKWKKFVKKKNLVGVHLFSDNSFDSAFMETYLVKSIPRFILIDPEGKIVNPDAPRPSFDKTRKLFNELLNE